MVFFDTFVHEPDLPYGGFTVYIKLFNLGILLASLLYTVFHTRFHHTLSPVFVYSAKCDGVRLPVEALLDVSVLNGTGGFRNNKLIRFVVGLRFCFFVLRCLVE